MKHNHHKNLRPTRFCHSGKRGTSVSRIRSWIFLRQAQDHQDDTGFTLIELLVAVAILTVLSTVGLVVYSSIRIDSRDNTRISHLTQIKQALELYRNDNRYYPETMDGLISTYIAQLPTDPVDNENYGYIPSDCLNSQCGSFILCATKEGNKSFDFPAGCPEDKRIGITSD